MAESAALEVLGEPARELEAMEDALALARKSRSKVGEGLALINLADIKLRRKEFGDALALSRRVARACGRVQQRRLDRHQQGEHRIRAVRPRPRERRQALRGRGARRIRTHRRHGRNRVAPGRIRPLSRESRGLPDGARVLPPRAQALRGDGGGRAPAVGARDAGEIRIRQEAARNRAAQSPERAQLGGARKPGIARARLVAVRRRSSRSRSS